MSKIRNGKNQNGKYMKCQKWQNFKSEKVSKGKKRQIRPNDQQFLLKIILGIVSFAAFLILCPF